MTWEEVRSTNLGSGVVSQGKGIANGLERLFAAILERTLFVISSKSLIIDVVASHR